MRSFSLFVFLLLIVAIGLRLALLIVQRNKLIFNSRWIRNKFYFVSFNFRE